MARLEAELTELWGHINAAEYRFLALLAEFDRLEGYARHGLAAEGIYYADHAQEPVRKSQRDTG